MSSALPSPSDVHRFQERLHVLAQATAAFAEASRSPERLFDALVREVAEGVHCFCALSLIAEDGIHFTTAHVYDTDPEVRRTLRAHLGAGEPRRIAAHPGVKHVVEQGTPFFMPSVDTEALRERAAADVRAFAQRLRVKSALVVPLFEGERVIGALGLTRHGESALALDDSDLVLAQSLAQHAGLALAMARVLKRAELGLVERERMAALLRVLADASHDFSEVTGDYDRLLAVIANRLGEVVGDLCAIRGLGEDRRTLESGAVYHRDPEIVAWAQRLLLADPQSVGEGLVGRVAQSGQPLFIPKVSTADLAASTSPQYRAIIARLAVGSAIFVPMICRDQVVGVATLLRSGSERPYTESDLNLVRSVADHAASAIANARSYAAERAARALAVGANEALHESEVAHRLLFDASPMPLLVYDRASLAPLAVNDAALRLYGYARAEFMRLKVSVLTGDDDDTLRARVSALPEAETTGLTHYRRKDGSLLVAEYTTRPLTFGGRRARISAINDVTARFEAEQTRALLAAIVESSNDAIVSKRLDGTITSWNQAAERLFGYSAAEVIGKSIAILFPPERLDEETQLLAQLAAGNRVDLYETSRRRKDGSEVVVSVSLAPVRDAFGVVIGASKTARELGAQRTAEEALRRAEGQLLQAQKMEAVGRLAGGIAHDFNNMLSVILSYSELIIADGKLDAPTLSDVSEIRNAALSAANLTRQLLMFSRQQVVAPRALDLNEVLAGMDQMLTRILGEDIDLVFAFAPGLGRALADPSNVEQVVMNLVVNARDAMPTGGKLSIETRNVELDAAYAREHLGASAGPHVMLAVSDTGVGMDRATQARIFEPFFTTKELGKGTGLGLSTVFGIAQRSGGSVWVDSEPGQGTTFKVYLPRVDAGAEAARPSLSPATLRGSETILLVEDQAQVRAVAQGILTRSGYRLLVAESAADALRLCQQHPEPIHLLLTDVVMPVMSGAELAKQLAVLHPETRVLCMSGYTDDSIVSHRVLGSGTDFLQKPFTPDSLAHKVREVLDAPARAPLD